MKSVYLRTSVENNFYKVLMVSNIPTSFHFSILQLEQHKEELVVLGEL